MKKTIKSKKTKEVKQMKLAFKIALMSLMTILMAGIVFAAVAIDRPDANEYVKGAYQINGTPWSGDALNGNCSNITVDYTTLGGSTYTLIGYNYSTPMDNITADWKVAGTFDTMALIDTTTYTLRARCINGTNTTTHAVLETATVNFKVDNTVPVTTITSPADLSKDTDGWVTFTYSCVNSSSADLHIESGGAGYTTYTMSESSDVCTYSDLYIPINGFHSWYITASDGYNSTTSSTTTVEVRKPGSSGTAEGAAITTTGVTTTGVKTQSIMGNLFGGGADGGTNTLGIIAVIVVGYLVFFRKKKGKK